jgi:beta-lactamase class A
LLRQDFKELVKPLDQFIEARSASIKHVYKRSAYAGFFTAVALFAVVLALMGFVGAHPPARAPLTAPRPEAASPGALPSYDPLRQAIMGYTAVQPGTFSVYFEDLASGQSFGINESTPVPEASCIKVPVVLCLYEQVAAGRQGWRDRVAYQQAVDYESGAGALQMTAEDGNTFSLRCLATIAITISDNIAHNMLVRYLGPDKVMNFIQSVGGTDTTRPYGSATTTAKDLGAFMEAVYRFADQNPTQGRRLISDLANSIFHVGLPGELPPDLVVAHKEGSISGVVNDMGIVFSQRPFILTVMSQGTTDEDTGFHNIAAITRLAYDYQQQLPQATPQKDELW